MADSVLVEEIVQIGAPRAVVFDLLTTARGLLEWMAVEAACEAVPGGVIRWRHENGAVMSGRFITIERPRLVVFTYGWERGGVAGVLAGSTRVEITLEEHAGGTRLRLVHTLLPAEAADMHRHGWRWFLERLTAASASRTSDGECPVEDQRP